MRRKPFHHVDYLVNICRSIGAEPLSGTLAFDPRNDVDRCAFAISRRIAPEVLQIARPQKEEGARKTGCALHPRSRVQYARESAHTSIQVQRGASGLPCAMALRLIARSSRRSGFVVTVIGGSYRRLDASVEASEPRVFTVRFRAVRQRHLRVHRTLPRVS